MYPTYCLSVCVCVCTEGFRFPHHNCVSFTFGWLIIVSWTCKNPAGSTMSWSFSLLSGHTVTFPLSADERKNTPSADLMLNHYLLVVNSPFFTPLIQDVLRYNNNSLGRETTRRMRHPEQNLLHWACKHVRPVVWLCLVPELDVSANGTSIW